MLCIHVYGVSHELWREHFVEFVIHCERRAPPCFTGSTSAVLGLAGRYHKRKCALWLQYVLPTICSFVCLLCKLKTMLSFETQTFVFFMHANSKKASAVPLLVRVFFHSQQELVRHNFTENRDIQCATSWTLWSFRAFLLKTCFAISFSIGRQTEQCSHLHLLGVSVCSYNLLPFQ